MTMTAQQTADSLAEMTGSVYSDGDPSKCERWSGMETMKHWAVDWLKWRPLPSPPTDHTPEEET